MLDSLLKVRYNNKRKILVDFSGFGHLFATQLSCDSCVAFLLPASRKCWQNGGYIFMENNFLSLIKTRRSVRAYKSEPVPSEALDAVLEAGTYAPTGGGHQSPTIIAITDPKYRQEIAKLNAEVMGSNTDPYYGAPVVILVLADGSASTFVEDGSCVLENMMLAAHALGLGTVWVHREREIFDSESGKALLREWKLPETLRGVGAIALGYPAQEAGQPAARKQNYIVRI